MNFTLFLDSALSVALSLALIGLGGAALWLLPWTDSDRDGTVRGFLVVARRAEATARTANPFRALPAAH